MLPYPHIDPVAVSLGPIKIHWYGLMYVIGIGGAWLLARRRTFEPGFPWTAEQIEDLIFSTALGLVIGGRVGYILFYNLAGFLHDPLMLFRVWEGGMAFHGGMLGAFAGMWLFARKAGSTFFQVSDFMAPFVPIGLFTGRIGNFINGELWGKTTGQPWGMVFPDGGDVPRHPTQLYEAFLEGVVLYLVLNWCARQYPPLMAISGMFLLLYGLFRFGIEFLRVPDAHLGYMAFDWLTMGQILSAPMIMFGAFLIFLAYARDRVATKTHP